MPPVKQHVEVEGRTIALTNLDKVLYSGSQFTKAQVIDYYIRVAPALLPHFENRPVTLNRFPDGVNGNAFYEKNAPKFTPDRIRRRAASFRQAGFHSRKPFGCDRCRSVRCVPERL